MAVLEGRGLFWWADEAIPEGHFAPHSCVSGMLTIENDGKISLELDSYLPSEHGPMSALLQMPVPEAKKIRGVLKGSGEHVLLTGLTFNGGQTRTNGISFERYAAAECLVCDSDTSSIPENLRFGSLVIPLSGYEEWLGLGSIQELRTSRMVSAKYKRRQKAKYLLTSGSLTLDFDLRSQLSGARRSSEFTMKETSSACLQFAQPQDTEEIKKQYFLLEELLIMLTTTDYALDWPFVGLDKNRRARLYFQKHFDRALVSAPEFRHCVTNFPALRDTFGDVWETWKAKREELGPGAYLYLGTRRCVQLYIENRFIMLVSGIEAFHRRRHKPSEATALQKKVERILGQITQSGDKKWLAKKLEHADEPSLGERIFETASKVPLGLDCIRLRKFADACNRLRNDISHFGGLRPSYSTESAVTYDEFLMKIQELSEVLAVIYQMLLLWEIGVGEERLKWWVFNGFYSFTIKTYFAKVGLIDESEVRTNGTTSQ